MPRHRETPRGGLSVAALGWTLLAMGCPSQPAPQSVPSAARGSVAESAAGSRTPGGDAHGEAVSPTAAHRDEHRTAKTELAVVERRLREEQARARQMPASTGPRLGAARLAMQRARLTGSWDDVSVAQRWVAEALKLDPVGPRLDQARIHTWLHRLDAAQRDLDEASAIDTPAHRRRLATARAELHLQKGEFEAAEAALAGLPQSAAPVALRAQIKWDTGAFDDAAELLDQAVRDYRGIDAEPRAWLLIQRGEVELERGRYDAALGHYRQADHALKGYWLVEEHIAEALAARGDVADALAMYERIVEDTERPELADALARLHRAAGDEAASARASARARAGHESHLSRFPEAAAGHAVEHFLDFGDPPRGLTLAAADAAARPHPRNKARLARAHAINGDLRSAKTTIDDALSSAWVSADKYTTAAGIAQALGDGARAEALMKRARTINPHAEPFVVKSTAPARPDG